MYYKPEIDKVKKRFLAFWNQEIEDRACISVIAPKKPGAHISMFHNPNPNECNQERLLKYWTDPQTIFEINTHRIENTFLGGDTLPIVFLNFGTSGHCSYLGAKPNYQTDTIWFDQVWDSLEDADNVYNSDEVLKKQLEIAKYLAENGKDRFYVSMPDNCGTLDAIGHLYGTQNLMIDMLVEPEAVNHVVDMVNNVWKKTSEDFYQLLYPYSGGGTHAWMHLWAPGRVQHMQVDLSVMISPQMYEQFALPELEQQLQWIDYPVYHFDGIEQTQHLDYILGLKKLKAIQWTHVAGQPSAANYIPTLKRMQEAGKSLIIMTPKEDIPVLMDNLCHKGLYFHTEAADAEQAQEIVQYVEKHTKG